MLCEKAKSLNDCMKCNKRKGKGDEQILRKKLCYLGNLLGFNVDEEWTPPKLKEQFSRREKYLPKIDLIWYKEEELLERFISLFEEQGVLPLYMDKSKIIVIGFELELTDRPTKYILGDISNLSRICTYGFIVVKNVENLVKRSKKASRAFSELHGASRVFVLNPEKIDRYIEQMRKSQ